MRARLLEILLVEDSPTDRLFTEEALLEARIESHLSCVEDGAQAVQFLRREAPYIDAPRPDLILLDLNLPKIDGRELLGIIKNDESLRSIPVVVLTTSQDDLDIEAAYRRHANCYITKPVTFPQLAETLRQIDRFWFNLVTLPRGGAVLNESRWGDTPRS